MNTGLVLALSLVVLGAACGDSQGTTDGSGGSAASGTASASTGTGGDGGGEPGTPTGSAYAYSLDTATTKLSGASAAYLLPVVDPTKSCTTDTDGLCSTTLCTYAEGMSPTPLFVSAGVVTITGGSRTITLTPGGSGQYSNENDNTMSLWAGGETLHFDVVGAGNIPPHEGDVTAPSLVTITSPDFGAEVFIDKGGDFVMTWTGGTAGDLVNVGISDVQTGPSGLESSVTLNCTFPAEAGMGSIDVAHLAPLTTNGSASIASSSSSPVLEVMAGEVPVSFSLVSSGATDTGSSASNLATIF